MNKIKVLYLAADPHSAHAENRPRLLLDEEIREVRKKLRTAKYGNALELDVHWAVRFTELLDTLNEVQPDVLHFSGHGGPNGITLVDADGLGPQAVNGKALASVLKAAGSKVRLVVLSSVRSLALAEVIIAEVDCVVGVPGLISDIGARRFNAAFYGALASGYSVQTAFEHARAELRLGRHDDTEDPELVAAPGVDLGRMFLLSDAGTSVRKENATPSLVISPTVFTVPMVERDPKLVSVMMPFAKEFTRTYQAIEKACHAAGLRCERADTVWQESAVIQDVFNLIYQSAAIVADLSDHNANVMYECGIAHTLGRPVVPISRSTGKDALPFDVGHHRVLRYLPNSQGHTQMRKQLESRLRSLTGSAI